MFKLFTTLFFICSTTFFYAQFIIVSNNSDSGFGSFRQAIIDCNSNPSYTDIIIDLPNNDVISLFSSLPDFTSSATISSNTMVYVDGNFMVGPGLRAINIDLVNVSNLQFINFSANTYYVTNTNNFGLGSFNQAIKDANTTDLQDQIYFNISGIAPQTISLPSNLSPIVYPLIIDGTSQPLNGYTGGSPAIILNGSGNSYGLKIASSYVAIYGLSIKGFTNGITVETHSNYNSNLEYIAIGNANKRNVIGGNYKGIQLYHQCQNVTIENNYIGTDETGLIANPNTYSGIDSYAGSSNITIKNNLISGNNIGLSFTSCTSLIIEGNKIGVNSTGNLALSNTNNGIQLWNNEAVTIGGTTSVKRNIISGNNSGSNIYTAGIAVYGKLNSLSVLGNYIGVNSTGTTAIPNKNGILIQDTIHQLIIGNGSVSGRNIISGNSRDGIYIKDNIDNVIDNNYIGTDVNGENAISNSYNGIVLQNGVNCTIQNNIISGNLQNGLHLFSLNSNSNKVYKNFIGTNATQTKVLGNGLSGIRIQNNSIFQNNLIGDYTFEKANVIANNGSYGINTSYLGNPTNDFNLYSYNVFYNNTNKGIYLQANIGNEYPLPTIDFISSNEIRGTASANDSVQIYYSQISDNYPQGKTPIATVYADNNGDWIYNGVVQIDSVVTCIAVNPISQFSSEFSSYDPNVVCHPFSTTQNLTICSGDSVIVGNNVYYELGVYIDELSTSNGCDSTVTTNITVLDTLSTIIDTVLLSGQSVVINGITYSTSGSYIDTLEGSNGCDSLLYITIDIYNGINKMKDLSTISIFPNPATNQFSIVSNTENNIKYNLIDPFGKQVITGSFTNKIDVNISKLPRGTYFVQVLEDSGMVLMHKIVLF